MNSNTHFSVVKVLLEAGNEALHPFNLFAEKNILLENAECNKMSN
jgi:hypothetical protein